MLLGRQRRGGVGFWGTYSKFLLLGYVRNAFKIWKERRSEDMH